MNTDDPDPDCPRCVALRLAIAEEIEKARNESEQLQVQLAGCLTAAEGYIADPALVGQYGWSVAYEAILTLRRRLWTERAEGIAQGRRELMDLVVRIGNDLWNEYADDPQWASAHCTAITTFVKRLQSQVREEAKREG